jgi:hypothetical protein
VRLASKAFDGAVTPAHAFFAVARAIPVAQALRGARNRRNRGAGARQRRLIKRRVDGDDVETRRFAQTQHEVRQPTRIRVIEPQLPFVVSPEGVQPGDVHALERAPQLATLLHQDKRVPVAGGSGSRFGAILCDFCV